MPIVKANVKVPFYEVSTEATDLLDGVNVAFAALTNPVGGGFPAGARGFNTLTATYNTYSIGSVIYARDTGRLWIVQQATVAVKVLVLITELSVNGAATSASIDMAYVVAEAGYGLSSTKAFLTIDAALAAIALSGLTAADIVILPGTYAAPATAIPVAPQISIIGMSGESTQPQITAGATDLTLAAGAVVSLANVQINPAIDCIVVGAGPNTINARNVTFNGAVLGTASVIGFNADNCDLFGAISMSGVGSTFTGRDNTMTGSLVVSGAVTVTTSEHSSTITATSNTAIIRRSTVANVTASTIAMAQSTANTLSAGSLDVVSSRIAGSLTATSTVSMDQTSVVGASTFSDQVLARHSSFEALVTFASAAPTTSTLTMCSMSNAANCLAVGVNDTVELIRCTAVSATGIAANGLGAVEIHGGLAGGGRVSTSSVSASVSDVQVKGQFALAAPGAVDLNTAITGLVDVVYITPSVSLPSVTLFDGGVVPDGFVLTLFNESSTFGYELVASAGDTFGANATTTMGPLDSRSYLYARTGATATIREIV